MSDWHFGMDYDMWLYPPVDWTAPDYDYELPEPIEAANIEGTLLVNAEDAIEQVHCLQAENAKLRNLTKDMYACISHANEADWFYFERDKPGCGMSCTVNGETCGLRALADRMRELGMEEDA